MSELRVRKTDICIVGAGPGGLACAWFLKQAGLSPLVLEKAKFPRDKICGDAFSGKSTYVLRAMNPLLEQDVLKSAIQLNSWGIRFFGTKGNELQVPFKLNYNTTTDKAPGFIAKREDFDNYLYNYIKDKVEIIQDCAVTDVEYNDDGVRLSTSTGNAIQTKLIIAADGAYSLIAKKLLGFQINDEHNSLGLRAYYKHVTKLNNDNFIELHFLNELLPGYFWIFPLPNGLVNVGAGIRTDIMRKKRIKLKTVFQEIINSNPYIKERFKHAELIDKPTLYGLPLGGPKRTISGNHVLLIGDAAGLIDPFTGEGIGNAMLSGMLATETIKEAVKKADFSSKLLAKYDTLVYNKLSAELNLSRKLQQLSQYPWLFNFVVNKARKNETLRETITCMFDNVDMRAKFKNPAFYFKLLFY